MSTYPKSQENLSHCLASVVRRPYLVTSNVSTKTAGPIGTKPSHKHNCFFLVLKSSPFIFLVFNIMLLLNHICQQKTILHTIKLNLRVLTVTFLSVKLLYSTLFCSEQSSILYSNVKSSLAE